MRKKHIFFSATKLIVFTILFNWLTSYAQTLNQKSDFWEKVQFGGGLGLAFGNITNVTVSPTAIYNINQYASIGAGLQYSYISQRNVFSSNLYGGSIIGLLNPLEEIQISAELEQLRVNSSSEFPGNITVKDNFWNTALFVGAGYRAGNVTIGGRYNVLYTKNDRVYGTGFQPFVRVFF